MIETVAWATLDSPFGRVLVAVGPRGLRRCGFADDHPGTAGSKVADLPGAMHDPAACALVLDQLDAYFGGRLDAFDLPLDPEGTPFQRKVWDALRTIPYGQTRTYGQVAAQIGQPTASRAVGGANNRNPLGIVVPCHRVVGAGGAMVGYAGGLSRKEGLLALERRNDRAAARPAGVLALSR